MSEQSAEYVALAALIRTVPIGPFGPNAKALINAGQTTFLTPHEAERLAEVLIVAGWTPPRYYCPHEPECGDVCPAPDRTMGDLYS